MSNKHVVVYLEQLTHSMLNLGTTYVNLKLPTDMNKEYMVIIYVFCPRLSNTVEIFENILF